MNAPKQNTLYDLLDQIEQRNERTVVFGECHIKDDSVHADIFVDEAKAVNAKLVKALRRAVDYIRADLSPKGRVGLIESDLAQLLSDQRDVEGETKLEEQKTDLG